MSSRPSYGPFAERNGPDKPRFGGSRRGLPRLIWRDLHPLLLRSAGVVGLAGTIVAVIASTSPSDTRPSQPGEQALVAASEDRLAAFTDSTSAPAASPVPAIAPQSAEATTASPKAAEAVRPTAAAVDLVKAPGPAVRQATKQSLPAASTAEAAEAQAALAAAEAKAVLAVALSDPEETPEAAAQEPSVWADPAANCPRDWMAVEGSGASGGSAECGAEGASAAAAAQTLAAVSPATTIPEPPLPRAAPVIPDEAAAEISPESLAPFPKPRPDPPAGAVKTASRSKAAPAKKASSGKLGPPPNCGKKYARWKYVNKKPTWYCK